MAKCPNFSLLGLCQHSSCCCHVFTFAISQVLQGLRSLTCGHLAQLPLRGPLELPHGTSRTYRFLVTEKDLDIAAADFVGYAAWGSRPVGTVDILVFPVVPLRLDRYW